MGGHINMITKVVKKFIRNLWLRNYAKKFILDSSIFQLIKIKLTPTKCIAKYKFKNVCLVYYMWAQKRVPSKQKEKNGLNRKVSNAADDSGGYDDDEDDDGLFRRLVDHWKYVISRQKRCYRFSSTQTYNPQLLPLNTWHKLNVHKTTRRRPGRLLYVLCAFNLSLGD